MTRGPVFALGSKRLCPCPIFVDVRKKRRWRKKLVARRTAQGNFSFELACIFHFKNFNHAIHNTRKFILGPYFHLLTTDQSVQICVIRVLNFYTASFSSRTIFEITFPLSSGGCLCSIVALTAALISSQHIFPGTLGRKEIHVVRPAAKPSAPS